MKINQLIEELERIREAQGNIEVTTTVSLLQDGYEMEGGPVADVFETNVENPMVRVQSGSSNLWLRVRLYL